MIFDTVLSSTVQSNELYVNYFCTGGDVETPYYEVSYYLVTWKDENSESCLQRPGRLGNGGHRTRHRNHSN